MLRRATDWAAFYAALLPVPIAMGRNRGVSDPGWSRVRCLAVLFKGRSRLGSRYFVCLDDPNQFFKTTAARTSASPPRRSSHFDSSKPPYEDGISPLRARCIAYPPNAWDRFRRAA
jgi:hypothetical protein